METLKKCQITKYDKSITKPPYLTIPLDEVEVEESEIDDLGVEFSDRLRSACKKKGFVMQFYSMSDEPGFDYEIVVYGDIKY